MPHFCQCGADTYLCQVCHREYCADEQPPKWRPDVTGNTRAGNTCPKCLAFYESLERLHDHMEKLTEVW